MLEGLWSIEFVSDLGVTGGGVIVVENNRVLGGDGLYYYVGSMGASPDGETVNGEVEVTHYHGLPHSVFGALRKFRVQVSGTPHRDEMILDGHLVENPDLTMRIRMVRRAELP